MKVRFAPLQAHCFAFGGFEMQMVDAMEAARANGVDAFPLDAWSSDAEFDILHVWGLESAHGANMRWAKYAGKKVIMTALLPYIRRRDHLRLFCGYLLGRRRDRTELLHNVDRLVVVNKGQLDTVRTLLRFPLERTCVIPNIVDDSFFAQRLRIGSRGKYILCTGNVCPRKNQLALVRACKRAGLPLMVVGGVLTGEDAYAEKVQREIETSSNIRWIRGLPHNSPELVSLYRDAIAFALVSYVETQPISLLEAAAVGCPLLIADRPYARQEYYANAVLVDPDSEESISAGLVEITRSNRAHRPGEEVLRDCSRLSVGRAYARVYGDVTPN